MRKILLFILLSIVAITSFSADLSPVGKWITISDKTQQPRSIIEIWENHEQLYGKVIKVYKEPNDTGMCINCPGKFKGKKIQGLTILWGLRQTGVDEWRGGKILDPKTGSIYSCEIKIAPDGKKLEIRGYIGITLFGRNQTWIRDLSDSKS